ncbi:hypothetical protein [Ramlibacter pallidus]|uniref:Lipoprotein n=1 Tax=Ramlibacter pallidus TaxID=2780087 RepID=A0ABR9RZQ1_9BURK|nr:hypothetical protein [Ramlibacter pallidus]MBE7366725.1 hypothetical protein [Ramlibacter pallidus]
MHYQFPVPRVGALRVLALSSALLLAACGGGGVDTISQSPGEQPPPVENPPPAVKRVVITAENQAEVAAQAGAAASLMGPVAYLFTQIMIPEPRIELAQRSAAPKAAAPVDTPAAALAESVRKFLPPKAPSRLRAAAVPAATETETYNVECTSGTGTVTTTYTEEDNFYSRKVVANLQNCQTDLRDAAALLNGKLEYTWVERTDEAEETNTLTVDILATAYSVKTEQYEFGLDGDMHMDSNEEGLIVTGKRFSVTGFGEALEGEGPEEVDAAAKPRTFTLIDYRQAIASNEDTYYYEITNQATVETDQFGETAIYYVATTQPLKYDRETGEYTAGQYKIVGAASTTLIITVANEGLFKLQRDDKGDGTIDDTVEGLTRDDLFLNVFVFF